MRSTVAFFFMLLSIPALSQPDGDSVADDSPSQYGYIILGAIILVVAIVVLIRKQHRKFNE
mgnify:CR=1 FL=1